MNKYKDNFDKLANSIYTKLTEAVQQGQIPQAPQQPVAQPQVDPTAGAVAGQAAAGAAMPADTGAAGAVDQTAAGAMGVEGQSMQTGMEGEEETDEVGMSEIQEMAGQLAQMIRDFKETNPDEFVEAAKFAAGMVVSAAISGLKYRDRKDILKKIKAGEFNQDSTEEQPEEQEGMVSERLRKDNSRNDDEKRKGLNPIEKRKKKSPKSPFSGVNEDINNGAITFDNNTPMSNIMQQYNQLKNNGANNIMATNINPTATGEQEQGSVDNPEESFTNAQTTGKNLVFTKTNATNESVKFTKRQLEMIRLSEAKTKFVKFSKKQLDEIINRQYGKNAQLAQKQNAVKQKLINDFFNNWDASAQAPTDGLSRSIQTLNSQSNDRSVNQEILGNAVVPYFLGFGNGGSEINDIETLNNYIANGGNTENLVIVKVGNFGAVIDFDVANNIINKHIRALRGSK